MNGRPTAEAVARARALLDGLGGKPISRARAARIATRLAALLWEAAEAHQDEIERERAAMLGRLMDDPAGQAFSNLVADRAYRSRSPERVVSEVRHLLESLGTPRYLTATERLQLGALRAVGPAFPRAVARGALRTLRSKTRSVILPASEPFLSEHLRRRRVEGVRVNLNWLGEAVLGEAEADRRTDQYLALLARPDVEAISVKVSTLTSRLNLLAWNATLDRLRPRLRALYRAALRHRYRHADGTRVAKLVNLDMEAYRDLNLTLELFCSVLEEPEFEDLPAGIVLQAYLPDSFPLQRQLTAWARSRVLSGGGPIRLRLVKGANLAAEQVEASLKGWPLPIYSTKHEVDANFKRMVEFGCRPANSRAAELGVASHNVFDLAYAMVVRANYGVEDRVSFELLEGMADPLQRAVREVASKVLLYGPVVSEKSMQPAIAYLIRRLDENTAGENFLRHGFSMKVMDGRWRAERRRFRLACQLNGGASTTPPRRQDRTRSTFHHELERFTNEPDTDFSRAVNRAWIARHLDQMRERRFEVPLQIGGVSVFRQPTGTGFDPSRPHVVPYHFALATRDDLHQAIDTAYRGRATWQSTDPFNRARLLGKVAAGLRAARGELIAAMVLDGGKRVEEADAEVSEAIDFAEYYRRSCLDLYETPSIRVQPKGVTVVTPPWNFPLAIPAGGTLAALASGNPVILKPALETPLVAWRFAEICWAAGVPHRALQFVLCVDDVASNLIRDERVRSVILTGGTATAQLFQELRPGIDLMAETGGKNSLVVSGMSDRDLAVACAVQGAFGHAGQKCSATSLLICEPEVYEDQGFREALRDAAASLPVGSAWDLDSVVTPLIQPPGDVLRRGLTRLDPGETWLLEPRNDPNNPRLWSPGIKLGVTEGSFSHVTELFGPVLSVMRAENLADAVRIANATPYGLTAGIASLDEREQLFWLDHMRAGNLYVNRGTTGAIVQRQPFGGVKASSFGPGAKAGGPNYVAQLVKLSDAALPTHRGTAAPIVDQLQARLAELLEPAGRLRLRVAAASYAWALEHHYGRNHDPSQLVGQVNVFCYRPLQWLLVRVAAGASAEDTAIVCAAALTCVESFRMSADAATLEEHPWLREVPGAELHVESESALAERLRVTSGYYAPWNADRIERIRALGRPEPLVAQAARHAGVHIASDRPLLSGRWELRHYVREQSICIDYHRYGNLSAASLLPITPDLDGDSADTDSEVADAG